MHHNIHMRLTQELSLYPFVGNPFYATLQIWFEPVGFSILLPGEKILYISPYGRIIMIADFFYNVFRETDGNYQMELGIRFNYEDVFPGNMTYYGLPGFLNPRFYRM